MKKISKVLALITGAAMAVPMAGGLQADAYGWGTINEINPEGYEQFEDYGLCNPLGFVDEKYGAHLVYWDKETHSKLIGYSTPRYNQLVLTVDYSAKDNSKIVDILNKYKEESKIDSFNGEISSTNENEYIFGLSDNYDANGYITFDRSLIPDRTETYKKMVDEMYATGLLISAKCTPFETTYQDGFFMGAKGLAVTYSYAEPEELYKLLNQFGTDIEITSTENDKKIVTYHINGFKDIESTIEACGVIQEAYPIADVCFDEGGCAFLEDVLKTYSADTINLLDPYICDIDGDGNANVTDATHILTAYAESAAGIQTLSDDNSMDVNGDGTVDLQDATYVLTYYAEAAAGLR